MESRALGSGPHRNTTRFVPVSWSAGALLLGLVLTGCGSADPGPAPTTTAPTTAATTAIPTPRPTPRPTPTPTRTPTRASTGNGDAEGDDTPATAGGGICGDLAAADVAAVLGGTVTGSALPTGGCEFAQRSPQRPVADFVESTYDAARGMDPAKEQATSAVEGEPEDLTGTGDAAFVVTGTAFGGDQVQGAGAVRVGSRVVNISLSQSADLTRAAVRALLLRLLDLAERALGPH